MRLKHIKGAEEIVSNSDYVIKNPEQYKGKYKELFNNNNPIYIEIGMGKGSFIINNALKYPNINFIGIEKYDSVMVKAIKKLEELNINNLKLIRMDAININNIFDKEISLLYLNFSDPWPKERHAKRRLTSPEFLKRYNSIFKDQKRIEFKTDNRKLFEYSLMTLNNEKYIFDKISLNLYEDDIKSNIPTEYEIKFSSKGFLIYMIKAYKD